MPKRRTARRSTTQRAARLPSSIESTVAKPRSPGRPTLADAVRLRQDFIRVALKCFLARGFAGTSIDALARESAVHKDTIYQQFGSKKNIYLAAHALAMGHLRERLRSIRATSAAPEKALLTFIQRLYVEHTRPELIGILRLTIAEAQQFPEEAQKLFDDMEGNLDALTEYLRDLSNAGLIDIDDPRTEARRLAIIAVEGGRSLYAPPYASAGERNAHARSVLAFFLKAWGYSPSRKPKAR